VGRDVHVEKSRRERSKRHGWRERWYAGSPCSARWGRDELLRSSIVSVSGMSGGSRSRGVNVKSGPVQFACTKLCKRAIAMMRRVSADTTSSDCSPLLGASMRPAKSEGWVSKTRFASGESRTALKSEFWSDIANSRGREGPASVEGFISSDPRNRAHSREDMLDSCTE
jgi:hypothetical protein